VHEPLSRSVQGSSTAQHAARKRKRAQTREDEHAGRVSWRLLGSCREANKFTGQANASRQYRDSSWSGSMAGLEGTAPGSFDRGFGYKIWTIGLKRVSGTNINLLLVSYELAAGDPCVCKPCSFSAKLSWHLYSGSTYTCLTVLLGFISHCITLGQ